MSFTTGKGDVQNAAPKSSRAPRRKADNQAAVNHSVKCSDGNPYNLVVLAVQRHTPTSCLEDEKRRLYKGRHSNNHPLQNH